MAAHSLEATRLELLQIIAFVANWDRNPDNWSADQKTDGYNIFRDALQQAYYPLVLPGDRVPHSFSWLRIKRELTLVVPYSAGTIGIVADAGGSIVTLTGGTWPTWAADGELWVDGVRYAAKTRTDADTLLIEDTTVAVTAGASYSLSKWDYAMPDDYGSLVAPETFIYRRDQTHGGQTIAVVGEAAMRRQGRSGDTQGVPYLASIMPVASTSQQSTRSVANFWPLPQEEEIVEFTYNAAPPMIDALGQTVNLFVYGGPAHALMIKASVEDMAYQKIHRSSEAHGKFLEQLQRSVQLDRRQGQALSRGQGSRSVAPTPPDLEEVLHEWRRSSPDIHDNINFG